MWVPRAVLLPPEVVLPLVDGDLHVLDVLHLPKLDEARGVSELCDRGYKVATHLETTPRLESTAGVSCHQHARGSQATRVDM